jgi:hypothetical protein
VMMLFGKTPASGKVMRSTVSPPWDMEYTPGAQLTCPARTWLQRHRVQGQYWEQIHWYRAQLTLVLKAGVQCAVRTVSWVLTYFLRKSHSLPSDIPQHFWEGTTSSKRCFSDRQASFSRQHWL